MTATVVPPARTAVGPTRRLVLAATSLAALAGAVVLAGPVALALWLVPDLALLAGMSKDFGEHGRLAPCAVPAYNALHALPGPLVVGVLAALVGSPFAAGAALAWLSHIAADRALGYGLRTRDGWQRG